MKSQQPLIETCDSQNKSLLDKRIPLTAIILTHDESVNIRTCLRALERVADVVIVDSGSSDATLALARQQRPDVRIFEHKFEDFGSQRNWALEASSDGYDWVLFVDADEYCDDALLDEIRGFIAAPGNFVGAYISGRNFFLGTWLKHATLYPSYQLRLLKRGEVSYRKEGHGQREVTSGSLRYLRNGWRHEAFSKGVYQWVARHNSYSTEEVELVRKERAAPMRWRELLNRDAIIRRRALKRLAARLPGRPLWRFLYLYVLRLGILDGRAGLHYCLLTLAHEVHVSVKLHEAEYTEASTLIAGEGAQR